MNGDVIELEFARLADDPDVARLAALLYEETCTDSSVDRVEHALLVATEVVRQRKAAA